MYCKFNLPILSQQAELVFALIFLNAISDVLNKPSIKFPVIKTNFLKVIFHLNQCQAIKYISLI